MKAIIILFTTVLLCILPAGCASGEKEAQLDQFITAHVAKVKPIAKEAALASWEAAVSGKPEDYDRMSELTLKIRQIYSDPKDFT